MNDLVKTRNINKMLKFVKKLCETAKTSFFHYFFCNRKENDRLLFKQIEQSILRKFEHLKCNTPRKLNPEERVSQSVIGHTHSLMYNRELTITLVYKYKVKNSRGIN